MTTSTASPTPRPPLLAKHPNLRVALVLGALSGIGAALVIPYLAVVLPELGDLDVSLWVVALASGVQNGILATGLALVGLKAGASLGLGAPHLAARINPDVEAQPARSWNGLGTSIGIAAAVAVVVLVVDLLWLLPRMNPIGDLPQTPGPLLGLLASFYGGIAEEVIVRLFAMSGIAWLLVKLGGPTQRDGAWPRVAIGVAVVLSAALFGALHLPTAFNLFEPNAWLVFRIVALNMALGIPFGLIFWKRGLEQAIAAHFCADLVLHVAAPLVLG